MSDFDRESPKFRLVETWHGDDLQALAMRELGDANRWTEIVWLNALVYPYITDDPARVKDGVVLSGTWLRVPAPAGWQPTDASERGQVYERDMSVAGRELQWDAAVGDFAVVTGLDNLRQQLSHRVATPRGQLIRHPEYGCLIYRLLGKKAGPTLNKLGAEYVRACLEADYRVRQVSQAESEMSGDAVRINAQAVAIEGGVVDVVGGSL